MTHLESLYGVVGGASHPLFGEAAVVPTTRLIREISQLPKNSKVAIEFFGEAFANPPILMYVDNGSTLKVGENARAYWRDIVRVCRNRDLQVVYLDDVRFIQKVAGQRRLEEQAYERFRRETDFKKARDYLEQSYKAGVEADYLFVVRREEHIVKEIIRTQPDLAIISIGHGDYLRLNPEELIEKGLSIRRYKRDVIAYAARDVLHGLATKEPPEASAIIERESMVRAHNAVTQGRIFPEKTADFIGTWQMSCRPEGLFEMYLNQGNSFSGAIYDILGNALFEGTITDKEIVFKKTYLPGASSAEAAKTPVTYRGALEDGVYVGQYSYQNLFLETSKSGDFSLNQGAQLKKVE